MDFHLKNRRLNPRKSCRGPVLVYELASGLPFTAELIDVSRGGVRLCWTIVCQPARPFGSSFLTVSVLSGGRAG